MDILKDNKLTSNIFKGKKIIGNKLVELREESIHEKIIEEIGGSDVLEFLDDETSFTAKFCLIDLYEKFSSLTFNEREQVKLKMVDIPRFECNT